MTHNARLRFPLLLALSALWIFSSSFTFGAGTVAPDSDGGERDGNALSPLTTAAGPEYLRLLKQAGEAFRKRDFTTALLHLDAADRIKPDLPDALNARGAIFLDQGKLDDAKQMFERAVKEDPGLFWAQFNLAEIEFKRKNYPGARAALEQIHATGALVEIVEFKMEEIFLLEKNFASARDWMDKLDFTGKTAAYYFAQAAWAFAHGEEENGRGWVKSGVRIFGAERCGFFADSLADAGWAGTAKTP